MNREEIKKLECLSYESQQDKNMFLFNLWTGLSVAELRALAWQDIDLENNIIHIKRAEVEGEIKCPKELVRDRKIEIIEPAKYWLLQQKPLTYNNPAVLVSVTQDDSISTIDETITYVFLNELDNQNKKAIPFTQNRWNVVLKSF